MRVSRIVSASGSTYRVYRSGDDFVAHVQRLIPHLRVDRYDVLIGGTDDEPGVVLTIGPLDATADAEFRQRVAPFLET